MCTDIQLTTADRKVVAIGLSHTLVPIQDAICYKECIGAWRVLYALDTTHLYIGTTLNIQRLFPTIEL